MTTTAKLTPSSEKRIKRFVDWFIRSEYVQNWTTEKDTDFFNEPDRANRCYEAAEFGADGKTHAEVIEDWREAFQNFCRYGDGRDYRNSMSFGYERFEAAVEAHFDEVEAWHEKNKSLHEEIG